MCKRPGTDISKLRFPRQILVDAFTKNLLLRINTGFGPAFNSLSPGTKRN